MGEKTIACLASQEIFKDLSCSLNTDHVAFLSSKNTGPLGDLAHRVFQYLFLEVNGLGSGREVREEA